MFQASAVATSLVTLAALFLVTPATPSGKDYTSLPPAPAERKAQIDSSKVTLAQAITAACQKTGGSAESATMTMQEGKPVFEVMLYSADKALKVKVDANGDVGSTTEIPRFPGDPVSGNWTETPSGLKYFDIRVGDGAKPSGPNATVSVHYTGWLVDGHKFDSSVDRGEPTSFPLGNVIPGWTEGLQSMAVGGKRKLIIPYKLGYGEMGMGGTIPQRATLIFDVELLSTN